MKIERVETKRLCIECFDKEDWMHVLNTGKYTLSFADTESIHLCQKHTTQLFVILKVALEKEKYEHL